ncbi:hypothetical protein D1159_18450, partial [Pseudoflavonifractor sp. 524-17]|uniref:OadG family protein n=1 Tax=Pseudoflavonifractor sp. 524-17 TaxID=2304577 RepID=UPI00137B04EB
MKMPIAEAIVTAVLGYGVVFFGLVLLMCVVTLMGKIMTAKTSAGVKAAPGTDGPTATAAPAAPAAPSAPPAP